MDINYDDYERTREEIIAKSMDKSYFTKVLQIFPINYELKSDLEKHAILNSYQL